MKHKHQFRFSSGSSLMAQSIAQSFSMILPLKIEHSAVKIMIRTLAALLLLAASLPLRAQGTDSAQSWTSSDGKVIKAKFVRIEAESVTIERNGKSFTLPFAKLSPASVALAKELGGDSTTSAGPAKQAENASAVNWHMEYTPSHRATFEQEWKYEFSSETSTRWIIALRYPPELAWSKDVEGKAELLTEKGWIPFEEVREGSPEKRRMLVIDSPRSDSKLKRGFTVRTSLTATICDQQLKKGKPAAPVPPLDSKECDYFVAATQTFNFNEPIVKDWMNKHKMWIKKNEDRLGFVRRVYKELRQEIPYDTKDGGPWICSQILKVGYGECARHAMVGTSILRANKIPARTVCALWAASETSKAAHCWGEFFMNGVGWVPYDTTIDSGNRRSEAYFGQKAGQLIAGMIDFDWVIDAGPFEKQTVQAIDAWPAFWRVKGQSDNPEVETTTSVKILKRYR